MNLDEFERHTEVTKDRFIAFAPRKEKIETLDDMKKIHTVKLINNAAYVKSDLDIDIDARYGLLEFHKIGNRVFCRIVINSILIIRHVIDMKVLMHRVALETSQPPMTSSEISLLEGKEETFAVFKKGVKVMEVSEGPGTFDKVSGLFHFRIGDVMKEIDENVDVLIAPRLVRELELYVRDAKRTKASLEANLPKEEQLDPKSDVAKMIKDNSRIITESEALLLQNQDLLYKDVTVEERYFRIDPKGA